MQFNLKVDLFDLLAYTPNLPAFTFADIIKL